MVSESFAEQERGARTLPHLMPRGNHHGESSMIDVRACHEPNGNRNRPC
jgi:hypothetical protein